MIEYLASKGMTEQMMDIDVKSVAFHGDEAEAQISFRPKGQPESTGFQAPYLLAKKGGGWTVKGRKSGGASQHGAGGMPQGMGGGTPNPHGAAPGGGTITPDMMPPSGGQMKMPPGHPAVPKQ